MTKEAALKPVSILGVPLALGCGIPGVELGPAAMRAARLGQRLRQLGLIVNDLGDCKIPAVGPASAHEATTQITKLKYLAEISEVCIALAEQVTGILEAGALPLILGGDHAIAAGSVSGVANFFRQAEKPFGLLWFDAHADMNTPASSPLAALLGFGAKELTHICGFAPKIYPQCCVHIGARDVDFGERELIKNLGLHCFTMRDIDEQGMSACIDQALKIIKSQADDFAVTFDIDALDPGDAPGSGTLVRGGLTYREAHLAMEKVAETGGLCSFEMVEINTVLDYNNRTAELGVELILSALGKSIL
jgi:arginase